MTDAWVSCNRTVTIKFKRFSFDLSTISYCNLYNKTEKGEFMSTYSERFWKKNWDPGLEDVEPKDFETTYVEMIRDSLLNNPSKPAMHYLGIAITYGELEKYSNQFANMLIENGFKKGDVVGINLPNTPQYLISLIGALKAGCAISGVSPLLSSEQIKYQINDFTAAGNKAALVTLDAIFAGHITKIAGDMPSLDMVITTNPASFLPKIKQVLGKLLKKVPTGKVTPLPGKKVLDLHKDVFGEIPRHTGERRHFA